MNSPADRPAEPRSTRGRYIQRDSEKERRFPRASRATETTERNKKPKYKINSPAPSLFLLLHPKSRREEKNNERRAADRDPEPWRDRGRKDKSSSRKKDQFMGVRSCGVDSLIISGHHRGNPARRQDTARCGGTGIAAVASIYASSLFFFLDFLLLGCAPVFSFFWCTTSRVQDSSLSHSKPAR